MDFYVIFFAFLFALAVNVQSYIIPREALDSDGCARIHNEFITKKKTNFSYADVKDCYLTFPFDKGIASKTIDTLTGLVSGFYVFFDKAKEPPNPGFDFRPVDLKSELENFKDKSYPTLYDFTTDVRHLFYDLKDPHTMFGSYCFTTFVFHTNMTFYSVVNNGEQKIKVFDDTIDQCNIDCEVTHIDGQPALNVITEFANDLVYASRDLGVRFNIALDRAYKFPSFAVRTELPEKSDITYTLKCDNKNPFDVKRNWNAFVQNVTDLNKFKDSKSYFDNICNPSEGIILGRPSTSFQEVTIRPDSINEILKQDQSIGIIKIIDDFISFYKVQDFGIVKFYTEQPVDRNGTTKLLPDVIQGFKELANTGVKKVVLDLSDNTGGYIFTTYFISLLLFPNTFPSFDFDIRISKQMRLVITEQYKLLTSNNIYDIQGYVDAKTYANFTSAEDFIGNNVYERGGIKDNYSNKYVDGVGINSMRKIIQTNLTTPLPWNPEDFIILTNGLCGSSCSLITEHAAEFSNISTVAIGGLACNKLLSYSSFTGGTVVNATQTFNSLGELGLLNNTSMPKPFPLTGMTSNYAIKEVYSKLNPDDILDFTFKPADFRLFYDEKNVRNFSILWSQAAALIGSKSKTN
ncbi:12966_t:CDS:2 [Gigaspora margarita]|uniref:12966_t:CDS:1 n=1 Tax=Gigaspora margarita TaxID=4874 RepID=A0ABN7UN02_GIGMA|nr:12966_t:CDS:2 [Gigaspora margarita]